MTYRVLSANLPTRHLPRFQEGGKIAACSSSYVLRSLRNHAYLLAKLSICAAYEEGREFRSRCRSHDFANALYLASRKYPAIFLELASDVTFDDMISKGPHESAPTIVFDRIENLPVILAQHVDSKACLFDRVQIRRMIGIGYKATIVKCQLPAGFVATAEAAKQLTSHPFLD